MAVTDIKCEGCGAYEYHRKEPGQATIVTIYHRPRCRVAAEEAAEEAAREAEYDAELAYDMAMREYQEG